LPVPGPDLTPPARAPDFGHLVRIDTQLYFDFVAPIIHRLSSTMARLSRIIRI
jgi:hypothetical protein